MRPAEASDPTRTVRTREARTAVSDRRSSGGPLVLERYRLVRRLGTGAFGTVWMARDEHLERDVAIKILARERVVSGRFEREAQAAARLSHPGVVTLYEAAVDDEGAYLVSELIRGQTLERLLREGRLSDRDILAIGVALCDALGYAHSEGVVHRDVKPANVLVPDAPVNPSAAAKLTDFGVARVLGADVLTATGDVVGTAAYMAPEQAEGLAVGAPADLYSLAVVLYEALTGVNPVAAALRRAGAQTTGLTGGHPGGRRLGATLPPLRRQRRDLPPVLGHAIDTVLRPRPSERGTLLALRRALAAAHPLVGDEPGTVAAPWAPTMRPARTADREPEPEPAGEPAALGDGPEAPPDRALAATAAAATAAWLTTTVTSPPPVPPAAAALVAAGLTLLLPRVGWLALAAAVGGTAAAQGRGGAGLVTIAAMLTPVALLVFTRATAWPLIAGAPALALLGLASPLALPGLAGAWPALAARATGPWRRATLGAAGWLALAVAAALQGRALYGPIPAGAAGPATWVGDPAQALHALLTMLTGPSYVAGAAVWAGGAVLLPWACRRRRSGGPAVLPAITWAIGLTLAVAATGASHPRTGALAIGGLAAALAALAPTLATMRRRRDPARSAAGFP